MNRFMSFWAGVLCGAAVGAVAALLLTPASGEELQEQARDQFDSLWDDARRAADEKRAELEAQLAALKRNSPMAPMEKPIEIQ
jgi:gas vesicle protein